MYRNEEEPEKEMTQKMKMKRIEDAGQLVIFCPKFHCELNFIKFWSAAMWYVRENCVYTIAGERRILLPRALNSVSYISIR